MFLSQNFISVHILQEITRCYILPKCERKPRENNEWDSGNGESNIGAKQNKNSRMTAKRNFKVTVE